MAEFVRKAVTWEDYLQGEPKGGLFQGKEAIKSTVLPELSFAFAQIFV